MNKLILFLLVLGAWLSSSAATLPVVNNIQDLRNRGGLSDNEIVMVLNGGTFALNPSNSVLFVSSATSTAPTNTTDIVQRVGSGRWIARRVATALIAPTLAEAATNSALGLSLQSGPGADNTTLLWTYPYGTKMTVFNGPNRAWELMNTLYPTGSLAFRIYAVTNWSAWKTLLDSSSTQLTANARYSIRLNSGGTDSLRHRLNLIAGTNTSLTLVDDPSNDESDVTVAVPAFPFSNLTGLPGNAIDHGITNVVLLTGSTMTGDLYAPTVITTNGVRIKIPTREDSTMPPIGLTMQQGDEPYVDWPYTNASKLSMRASILNRGWELINTGISAFNNTNGMAFRYRTVIGWSPWIRFVDDRSITNYMGAGHGWDSDLLDGFDGLYYLNRTNHYGTVSQSNITGLGTGALLFVPVSGDALATNLMLGSDTRNTNARTPLAHTHPVIDLSDSGAFGRSIAQTVALTNALNLLGTSWSSNASLVLNAAGQWTTVPASGAATNGIMEAPTNGIAYQRKNATWVGSDIADVAGLTTFGRNFITTATNFSATNISDSSAVGRGVLTNATAALQRAVLGIGTAGTYDVPVSGDALATNVVLGSDTRLTNNRAPTAHGHPISEVTNLQASLDGKLNLTGGTLTGNLIGTAAKFTNGVDTLSDARTNTELVLPSGIATYSGPGGANDVAWQYPFGTKLSVYHNNNRSWEFMNTTYPDGSMAFRIHDVTNWSPWKVLLDDTTGVEISDFAAHTNLTAGAHGISAYGSTLVAAATPTAARTILEISISGTNRVVTQNIMDSTAIVISNALNTTYFFTGGQEDSSPHTFVVPTNDVVAGATLSIVVVGTNVHNFLPLQYYFVYSGVTNRLYDSNRLDLVYTGTQWNKKPTADWAGIQTLDTQNWVWSQGAPRVFDGITEAGSDSTPWVRWNASWRRLVGGANVTIAEDGSGQIAIASTGGSGGSTNGSSVSVDGTYIAAPNFGNSSEIDIAASGSNVSASLLDGSVGVSRLSSTALTYIVNRTNAVGTQPWSTLSDASTNVWLKTLSMFQRGNGIDFATNAGANTLTISGNYVPGANVTFTTNAGTKQITIAAASGGGGATNGTYVTVNGVSPATANFTNGADITPQLSGSNITMTLISTAVTNGTYTNATITVDAKGRVTFAASGTASSSGGAGTNVFLNGVLKQPARFTNSATVTWTTNAGGDIIATASGGGSSATNVPLIAVDGVATTNINLADSAELLVTQSATNVTYALATSGVAAGTYSNATITVNSKGIATAVASGSGGSVYTNTTDQIWRTVAGVSFVSTNSGSTFTAIDDTKTVYSGAGTNLVISGSDLINQSVYFTLEFNPPRANTNYLVFGDFESSRGLGPATIFVNNGTDLSDGRKTNSVTFGIYGDVTGTFTQGGNRIRVWVVDPNTLISGDAITGLDASIITSGTFDVARMPSSVLLDSEAALLYGGLNNNNNWTGTQTFTNDVDFLGDVSFNMLTVGAFQSTTWTNTGNLSVGSNITVAGSATISGAITAPYVLPTAPWQTTYEFTEMYNQNGVTASANTAYPWGSFALAGGTLVASDVVSTNHPGIARCTSAAANSSGYGFAHRPTTMYLEQGMRFDFIFRPLLNDTNFQADFGWLNNINVNTPNQGLTVTAQGGYLTVRGYTGTTTPNFHSVSNAYSTNVWYRGSIEIGPDGSRDAIVKVVESDTGNSIMNTTFSSSSFPARTVAVGNDTRAFLYASTGVTNICDFDYLGILLPTQRR